MRKIRFAWAYPIIWMLFGGCTQISRPATDGNYFDAPSQMGAVSELYRQQGEVKGNNEREGFLNPQSVTGRFFAGLNSLLKLVLTDKTPARADTPSEDEIKSFYLDSFRFINDFATVKENLFPQQPHSEIEITVLEFLAEGAKPNIRIDSEGFVETIQENINNNMIALAQQGETQQAVSQGTSQRVYHDVLVTMPVTRGMKGKFIGYNKTGNTDINYFHAKRSKDTIGEIGEEGSVITHLFPDTLVKQVDKGTRIISVSYSFKGEELEDINRSLPKPAGGEYSLSTIFNEDAQWQSRQEAYLLLVALANKSEAYNDSTHLEKLKQFQGTFPNAILVSTSGYQESGGYTVKRDNLGSAGVEFFTVLGDNNVSPTDPLLGNMGEPRENTGKPQENTGEPRENTGELMLEASEKSTSFATPVLAQVVFNILSLNPWLNSSQVKEILRKTAMNHGQEDVKNVGHLVDPSKAYLFTLGLLVANTSSFYHRCDNPRIQLNGDNYRTWSWTIECGSSFPQTEGISWVYKDGQSLADFYQDALVYTSSVQMEDKAMVALKRITEAQTDANRGRQATKIVIRNLEVEYGKEDLRARFVKEFFSPEYQDVTSKEMVIGFQPKDKGGKPQLRLEYVTNTQKEANP